jgi:sugar phosphate isomerase/epimerase
MKRRVFLSNAASLAASALLLPTPANLFGETGAPLKRFKLGVISDGLSPDFETALKIMKSYGISWVEIRMVWDIYNTELSAQQIRQLKDLLDKYEFRCSQVDTALFKCTLPGTHPSVNITTPYPYAEQMDLLKRASERAHAWGTDKIRIFTFWRVAEPQKISGRISDELHKAAEVARASGIRLAIENEETANVATGHELAAMLKTLPANAGANWDIGNGLWQGEIPYPNGYKALNPKRIWHMHLKGAQCAPALKNCEETTSTEGQINLKGQLQALLRDDYQGTMSLECEFTAPGLTHQQTTQRSLEGLLKVMSAAVAS